MTVERKANSMQVAWRHASGRSSTLSVADAKKLIAKPPLCVYCLNKIEWQQLSIDHLTPTSRGGSSEPDNLRWVCRSCNLMKSDLTMDEYKALLVFLEPFPRMKESVLTRFRMAGAAFGRYKRWRV